MAAQFLALSKEYVRVPIAASANGVAVNPTGDVVQFAFRRPGDTSAPTYANGDWETAGTTYLARALIGPGTSFVLAAGVYDVLVKITDAPEVPVLDAGQIEVL